MADQQKGRDMPFNPRPQRRQGLYFLFRGEELTYIGESECIDERIATHARQKEFDFWLAMELPAGTSPQDRKKVEGIFLRAMRARDNSDHLSRAVEKKAAQLLRLVEDAKVTAPARRTDAHKSEARRPDRLSYTLQEAAAATGLSVATLRRHEKAGRLRFAKIGARTLIPAEQIRLICAPPSAEQHADG